MDAERKSVRLRKQAAEQRQHVFEIAEKYEEQLIFERITEEQRDQLDAILYSYQRNYGSVTYEYWLRAVVRKMKPKINYLNQVLVFELESRTRSDNQKIKILNVMAKQMLLDVTIANNRIPKPGKYERKLPKRMMYGNNL